MRNKRFPYYKDWNIIFGKYSASGEKMETVSEAINEVLQKDKGKAPLSPVMLPTTNAANSPSAPMAYGADSGLRSRCHGETVTSPNKIGNLTKKRSRMGDGVEKDMVNLMGKFLGETKTNLGTERESS